MELPILIANSFAAFLTSSLSAILGMAGGILLLAIMLSFQPITLVVPLHGVVQLASNVTRVTLFFRHIRFSILFQFVLTMLPASLIGVVLVGKVSEIWLKLFVVFFILFSLFNKNGLSFLKEKGFFLAGFLSGSVALIVGAVGPLISPFFLKTDLKKEEVIATTAACQASTHLVKVAFFSAFLDFDFILYAKPLLVMVICVILGTWFGKNVLRKWVSEELFKKLYRYALSLIALKILILDIALQIFGYSGL